MLSLQFMCLDLIVEKFQQFNVAFHESKDVTLQRNFKFLQRRFSDHLAEKLLKDENSSDMYFDFLINEHLKYLDFDCFRNSPYLDSIDDIFCRLPKLTRISFSICGNEILKSIAKFCPNIVEIHAPFSTIEDKGIKYLCEIKNGNVSCPKLKKIIIRNSLVTRNGIEYLIQHLPLLEVVDHKDLAVLLYSVHKTNSYESQNVHYYNLIELDLKGCEHAPDFIDILKTCIDICPKLESISLCVREMEQLEDFNISCLKKLDLGFRPNILYININSIFKVKCHNLTHLRISRCTISVSLLAEYCPALENLSLTKVKFTDDDDDDDDDYVLQSVFSHLTRCSFHEYDTPPIKGFRLLTSSSPKLEYVSFSHCWLSSKMKNEILIFCRSPSIKHIQFTETRLEINFLKEVLLKCHSLKRLSMHNGYIDERYPVKILKDLAKSLPNKPIIERSRQYLTRTNALNTERFRHV